MRKRTLLQALALFALSGVAVSASRSAQGNSVTVTGCIERDAAASTPIYKVIVSQPDGTSAIYQLNAPGDAGVPAAVGKLAKVTGALTTEKRAGRDVKVIVVKALEVVADGCRKG